MYIKASSITSLTDARYFAAKEVTSLGFCLDEGSEQYIAPHLVKAIKEWVEGPAIIGEFGLQSTDEILAIIQGMNLDALQLSMFSTADTTRLGLPIIQEIIVENTSNFAELQAIIVRMEYKATFFLLDLTKNNLTWAKIVASPLLEGLQRLAQKYQILLHIDSTPTEIKTILKLINPYGLSLKGGDEERVGVKSFDQLDDIFDVIMP